MPTITPSLAPTSEGVPRVLWEGMASGDTILVWAVREQHGLAGSVQISGTFGGATVTMQVSNDSTTWFTAKDVNYNDISVTENALFEFSNSAAYIRFAISGGTSDDVDAYVVFRG